MTQTIENIYETKMKMQLVFIAIFYIHVRSQIHIEFNIKYVLNDTTQCTGITIQTKLFYCEIYTK